MTQATINLNPAPSGALLRRWAPLLTALLAVVLFLPVLGAGYVYDDNEIILNDQRIKSPARIAELWTQQFYYRGVENLYRPLSSTTYALQWWLHGSRAWAFHGFNLALHAAATAGVTLLALRLFGTTPALIAGVLFAVHPSRTEIVGIAAYRTEALVTLFSVGACVVALGPWTRRRIVALMLLALAALLSKEQAVVLPFVLAAIWWARRQTHPPDEAERRRVKVAAVVALWALSGYLVARETLLPFMTDPAWIDVSINPVAHADGIARLLWPIKILGRYVQLLLAPGRMSIDHGGDSLVLGGWRDGHLWLGGTALVLVALLAATWVRRRQWMPLVCLFAACASYFTISNTALVIGTHFGERLLYLPSAFLLPLVGRHLAGIRLGSALAAALAIGWAVVTVHYARQWTSADHVYFYSRAQQPRSIRMPLAIAYYAQLRGDPYIGEVVLADARRRLGHYWEVWAVSANGLSLLGQHRRADACLVHALDIAPTRATIAVMGMRTHLAKRRERFNVAAPTEADAR